MDSSPVFKTSHREEGAKVYFLSICHIFILITLLLSSLRVCLQTCSQLNLQIFSNLPKAEFLSPSFRSYLLSSLSDLSLFQNSSFNLSWRGEIIVCLVTGLISSSHRSPIDPREVAYKVDSSTEIQIRSPTEEISVSQSAGMAILLEGLPEEDALIQSKSMTRNIGRASWETLPFAGYEAEVEEAKQVIEAGLDLFSSMKGIAGEGIFRMKFKRPRGLLLSGPRGAGKTLLMNSLKEFFSPWFNSIHSLSPDILLSRFVTNALCWNSSPSS